MTGGHSNSSLFSVSSAYAALFAFSGFVIGIYVIIDIHNHLSNNSGLSALSTAFIWLYAIMVIVSAYHQLKIYQGFHQIETEEDRWKNKTGGWAGSGGERFFRFVILLVILGAFAKGGPVLDFIVLASKIPCMGWLCLGVPSQVYWFESINSPENKSRIFLALISVTFFLFIVWELLAVKAIKKQENFDQADVEEIWTWMLSDFLGLLIWSSIAAIFILDAPDDLFLLPVLLMFLYFWNIWLRYRPKRKSPPVAANPEGMQE